MHTILKPILQSKDKLFKMHYHCLPWFGVAQTRDSSCRRTRRARACTCCSWLASWWKGSVCAGRASCRGPRTPARYRASPTLPGRRSHHQGATHCNGDKIINKKNLYSAIKSNRSNCSVELYKEWNFNVRSCKKIYIIIILMKIAVGRNDNSELIVHMQV